MNGFLLVTDTLFKVCLLQGESYDRLDAQKKALSLELLNMRIMKKKLSCIVYVVCLLALPVSVWGKVPPSGDKDLKVLLVTGGHGYDKENFGKMLAKLPGITYDMVAHPKAHAMLKADKISGYDVILLYDMPKEISEEAQKDFIAMLEAGKGLVALHHAFCSYDFWPEYTEIIGGRYHHYPWERNGMEQPLSVYAHDVVFDVKVEDADHPVTKGIQDFTITDETYGLTEILPTVHPLLSTEEPTSGYLVCWANQYANARVVTLTLGHDKLAWENPSFFQVLSQAIIWVGQK